MKKFSILTISLLLCSGMACILPATVHAQKTAQTTNDDEAQIFINNYVSAMNGPEVKKVLVESGSFSDFSVYNNDKIITHELIFDDGTDLSQLSQSEKDQLLNSFKFAFMSQLQEETVSFMKAHDIVFLIKFKDKKGHSISTNTF